MAQVDTIVVGGGIAQGPQFVSPMAAYVSSVDPAQISTSTVMRMVEGASDAVTINADGSDPDAAGAEILRVRGGISSIQPGSGTNHQAFGRAVTLPAARTGFVAVGQTITPNATAFNTSLLVGSTITGDGGICVGTSLSVGTGFNFASVLVGSGISLGNGAGGSTGNNTLVGNSITVGAGGAQANVFVGSGLTIGTGVTSNACVGNNLVMGNSGAEHSSLGFNNNFAASTQRSVALGPNHVINHNRCIAIGVGMTTTADHQCLIGESISNGIQTVIIGAGNSWSSPGPSVAIRLTNVQNGPNNQAGGNLTLQAGIGSGSSTPAQINFVNGVAGASGNSTQGTATRARIDAGNGAGTTALMIYDVDNNTLERVTVGAADSGGAGFKVLRIPN